MSATFDHVWGMPDADVEQYLQDFGALLVPQETSEEKKIKLFKFYMDIGSSDAAAASMMVDELAADKTVYMICYDSAEFGICQMMITLTREHAQSYIDRFESGDFEGVKGVNNVNGADFGWYIKEVPVVGVRFLNEETCLTPIVEVTNGVDNQGIEIINHTVTAFQLYDPTVSGYAIIFDTYFAGDIVNGWTL
jgi:hypothetical protein